MRLHNLLPEFSDKIQRAYAKSIPGESAHLAYSQLQGVQTEAHEQNHVGLRLFPAILVEWYLCYSPRCYH